MCTVANSNVALRSLCLCMCAYRDFVCTTYRRYHQRIQNNRPKREAQAHARILGWVTSVHVSMHPSLPIHLLIHPSNPFTQVEVECMPGAVQTDPQPRAEVCTAANLRYRVIGCMKPRPVSPFGKVPHSRLEFILV